MSAPEIPGWDAVKGKTFRPQLTIRTSAPVPEAVDVLASALEKDKFKIKDRAPEGFRARYVNWLGVLATTLNSTRLTVTATADGPGAQVLVGAEWDGEYRAGSRHASSGLSAGVRELRRRGYEVTAGSWVAP